MIISLTGFEENLIKGFELLKHWITGSKLNDEVYEITIELILEKPKCRKKDKSRIMDGIKSLY